MDKLKPFLEKNDGNLSAAIRDTIETASLTLAGKMSENGDKSPSTDSHYAEFRNKLIEEKEFLLVHRTLLEWLIKKTSGLLMDESIIYELINPYKVKRIPDIVNYLNSLNEKIGWKIKFNMECDQDFEPEAASLTLSNGNFCFREVMAHSLALFMAKQMKLDVQGLFSKSNVTNVYFKRFEFLNHQKVPKGVEEHFGSMESTFREVQRRPDFWKNLIKTYKQQNYQRLSINRRVFETFISGNIPSVAEMTRYFELAVGKPPAAFTLAENIKIFKELYLTDGIGTDIEICTEKGSEYVKLIHDFSNLKVCECIKLYYLNIFKSIGHPFTTITNPHMIVFEFGESFNPTPISEPEIIGIES